MRLLTTLLFLFVACQPIQTPQEMLAAHYSEDIGPRSTEEQVAWANSMMPPELAAGLSMVGSEAKLDIFFQMLRDVEKTLDRVIAYQATKPADWEAYKANPTGDYIRARGGVGFYLRNDRIHVEAVMRSNRKEQLMPQLVSIFTKFRYFDWSL